MFRSIATILAALAGIARDLVNRWLAKEQQQIGKDAVTLDALLKERDNATERQRKDEEIARLADAARDGRLAPWMRD